MKLILLLFLTLILSAKDINVSSVEELQKIFKNRVHSINVKLAPGIYNLNSKSIIDSSCGNCENPNKPIAATAGLILRGRNIKLTGPKDHSAVIHTNSGYGIFILNSQEVVIEKLVITGGERDINGMASDAAIVVKNSDAVIRNNIIKDNIGDSSKVVSNIVGIMGICGRENSDILIENNQILRNSWDGIALYRDAEAKIKNNLIDGIDKATSKIAGGGRGVAVGVTWNAAAEIKGNLLRRYWKGVGIFVDAEVIVENNIIEDMITWGIAYWDADKGNPVGFITNNIIYKTGACGVSIARNNEGANAGELQNNVIVKTGQNPKYDAPDYYCAQCALAIYSKPESFVVADNLFYSNRRAPEDLPDFDLDKDNFSEKYEIWISKFKNEFYNKSSSKEYIETEL